MSNNLKDSIKSNIKKKDKVSEVDVNEVDVNTDIKVEDKENITFKIGKKQDDKNIKKSFPLYVDAATQKELDKIVKKTGYSRNELINLMIKHCLDNLEFTK